MKTNHLPDLRGMNTLIRVYLSYELGMLPEEQIEEFDKLNINWKQHTQTIIAKSLIASLEHKIVIENPELEHDDVKALIAEDLNKNLITMTRINFDIENLILDI